MSSWTVLGRSLAGDRSAAPEFRSRARGLGERECPVKDCLTNRHVASSAQPFGIVVWGTARAASYGYPAGGNFASVNTVVVPPVVR